MNYLTVFNFVVNLIIVGYFAYKHFPFYISKEKTTWCERTYAFTLMMYVRRSEFGSSSKGIFTIPIRNYEKAVAWDDEMFRSGKYKQYQK